MRTTNSARAVAAAEARVERKKERERRGEGTAGGGRGEREREGKREKEREREGEREGERGGRGRGGELKRIRAFEYYLPFQKFSPNPKAAGVAMGAKNETFIVHCESHWCGARTERERQRQRHWQREVEREREREREMSAALPATHRRQQTGGAHRALDSTPSAARRRTLSCTSVSPSLLPCPPAHVLAPSDMDALIWVHPYLTARCAHTRNKYATAWWEK